MAREKKITVKPLLNTIVKPIQDSPLEEPKYPLYLEVTYNRKYTKFPFGESRFPLSQSDKLMSDPGIKRAIEAVKKIVRFEAERVPGFTITGLSDTIKSYLSNLPNCILLLLLKHIEMELKEVLTVAKYEMWQAEHIVDKVPKGLDLLGEDRPFLINDLLASLQLTMVSHFFGSILEWQIYADRATKLKWIEGGLQRDLSSPLYSDRGGLIPASKKMTASELLDGMDEICGLIVDNQVSINIEFISVKKE